MWKPLTPENIDELREIFTTLAVKVKVRSSIRKGAVYRGDPDGGHGKQE